MPPIPDAPNEYAVRLRDTILDRSALIEEMVDTEGQVFMDWAMTQADRVGASIHDENEAESQSDLLLGWLKDISRLVTRRQDRDAEWFSESLQSIDETAKSLGLAGFTDTQKAAINEHGSKTNLEFLQEIINALSSDSVPTTSNEASFSSALLATTSEEPSSPPPATSFQNAVNNLAEATQADSETAETTAQNVFQRFGQQTASVNAEQSPPATEPEAQVTDEAPKSGIQNALQKLKSALTNKNPQADDVPAPPPDDNSSL